MNLDSRNQLGLKELEHCAINRLWSVCFVMKDLSITVLDIMIKTTFGPSY